jgi:hypothetical protein
LHSNGILELLRLFDRILSKDLQNLSDKKILLNIKSIYYGEIERKLSQLMELPHFPVIDD